MNDPLLKNFFSFLKKPTQEELENKSFLSKIIILFRIYAFEIGIAGILAILISIILNAINYNIEKHSVTEFILTQNIFSIILLSVIIAPIIEELTFRLVLKYSAINFSIFLSLFIRFLLSVLSIFGIDLFQKFREIFKKVSDLEGLVLNILVYLFFLVILPFLFYQIVKRFNQQKLKISWKEKFGFIFYLFTLLFTALHIFNYDDLASLNFYIIILILPQFVAGLALGYTRIRLGMKWSIVLHMIHNASGVFPIVLLSLVSTNLKDLLNNNNAAAILNLPANEQLSLSLIGLVILLGLLLIFAINIFNIIEIFTKKKIS